MNGSRFLRGNFEELGLCCSLTHAPPQSWLLQEVLVQVPGDPFLSREQSWARGRFDRGICISPLFIRVCAEGAC